MSRLSGPEEAIVALIKLLRGRPQGNSIEVTNRRQILITNTVQGARLKDTIYQNTTGAVMMCLVTVHAQVPASPVDTYATCVAYVASVTPPNINLGSTGLPDATRVDEDEVTSMITFMVPPGHYYKLQTGASAGALLYITHWIEVSFV